VQERADESVADKIEPLVDKLYAEDISDAQAVMQKTVEFGKVQAMINAVLDGADEVQKGNRAAVLPLIHEASLVGEDILNVGIDYKVEAEDRLARYLSEEVLDPDVIPTGLPHLDYAMGGGLSRGELGVVLAPPKRGKSTTLINFGFGALSNVMGLNVVHYTMEMSDKKVAGRYDDRVAGPLVEKKHTAPEQFTAGLGQRIKTFVRGRLFIKGYPTRTATATMLRTHLSLLVSRGFAPDMVLVDYADIMKAERRVGEMRHEQAGIYEDLRQMAGEFNCAVWTGSQAPRSALEKPTLDLGDFAEAFEKAAIVDAAIAFCQTPQERLDLTCRLVFVGLRNSEDNRMVMCRVIRDRCLVKPLQLMDSTMSHIPLPGEDEDESEMTESQKKVAAKKEEVISSAVAAVKLSTAKGKFKLKLGGKKEKLSKKVELSGGGANASADLA